MQKEIIAPPAEPAKQEWEWLDLNKIAVVGITSENPANPIDFALLPEMKADWTAEQSGEQTLELRFKEPQKLRHIHLVFHEKHYQRTQEFVLRWAGEDTTFYDIVRQQYNFNPPATETEEYDVKLDGVATLQLKIIPDISGGGAIASLGELRLA